MAIEYRPYKEIASEFEYRIPYAIRLTAIEWQTKREAIITRSNNVCEVCKQKCMDDWLPKISGNFVVMVPAIYGEVEVVNEYFYGFDKYEVEETCIRLIEQAVPKIPHVHHKYYILGRLPWEYLDNELMLVCHTCHKEIHETQTIKVYKSESKDHYIEVKSCSRCSGVGFLSEYNHFKGGICFKCNGERFEQAIL